MPEAKLNRCVVMKDTSLFFFFLRAYFVQYSGTLARSFLASGVQSLTEFCVPCGYCESVELTHT